MTATLLDVNLLIALLDSDHADHEAAHRWAASLDTPWATCPITENGVIRILSQPKYPNHVPLGQATQLLRQAMATASHQFWPCDVSFCSTMVDPSKLIGSKQVTDTYLLALAVQYGGRLATFDTRIALRAVPEATPAHLVTVPSK